MSLISPKRDLNVRKCRSWGTRDDLIINFSYVIVGKKPSSRSKGRIVNEQWNTFFCPRPFSRSEETNAAHVPHMPCQPIWFAWAQVPRETRARFHFTLRMRESTAERKRLRKQHERAQRKEKERERAQQFARKSATEEMGNSHRGAILPTGQFFSRRVGWRPWDVMEV